MISVLSYFMTENVVSCGVVSVSCELEKNVYSQC